MKKGKVISIIFLITGIILIISGYVASVILEKEQTEANLKEKEDTIVTNFQELSNQSQTFSNYRDELYKSIFNGILLTDIPIKEDEWHQQFEDYEKIIDDIVALGTIVTPLCEETYENSDINSKCREFEKAEETILNGFIKDVSKYNQLVITYNEQKTDEEQPASLYESKYNNYYDINQDEVYSGKD